MSFRPVVVWLSGGEPLIREDIVKIVKNIKAKNPYIYLGMVTNGWLLNSERCRQLVEAGLDQVNISLDFIGDQHDEYRQIDGLFNHIANNITDIARQELCVVLTTCILRENLDWLLRIAELAETWGVKVGYSCYSAQKTGDKNKRILKEQISQLQQIVSSLCQLKKERGVIKSSNSYLRKIPKFFETGSVRGCQATKTWLYMTPDGFLKICPDKQIYANYKEYAGSLSIDCGECWYTCRGEMETPVFERLTWELWNA
jgi:MoaA/NifB/PqqE/SkfB family radical SAM enzyme